MKRRGTKVRRNREKRESKSPEGNTRRGGRRAGGRGLLIAKIIVRPLLALVTLIVLLLAYLDVFGLPASLMGLVVEQLGAQGVIADIGHIRLDLVRGVLVDGVHLFDGPDRKQEVMSARRVALRLKPWRLLRGEEFISGVRVRDGRIFLTARERGGGAQRIGEITGINLDVASSEEAYLVRSIEADIVGLGVQGRGRVLRSRRPARGKPLVLVIREIENELARYKRQIVRVETEMRSLRLGRLLQADVDFDIDPDTPAAGRIGCAIWGRAAACQRASFRNCGLSLKLLGRRLRLVRAVLRVEDRELRVNGSLDLDKGLVEGRIVNSIPPDRWISLLPGIRKLVRESGIGEGTDMGFDMTFGPVPLTSVWRKVQGNVTVRHGTLLGIPVEDGSCRLESNGDQLLVRELDVFLGRRDAGGGRLRAGLKVNFVSKEYQGSFTANFDPHVLAPIFSQEQAEFVKLFTFTGALPSAACSVEGRMGDPKAFRISGEVKAQEFAYRGVGIQSGSAHLHMENQILDMNPLVLIRDEGRMAGRVCLNFPTKTISLDVLSTLNPWIQARMIGPQMGKLLEPFSFEGPVTISVRGRVDYGSGSNTDFHAEVSGKKMGYDRYLSDECGFEVIGLGDEVLFTNISGRIYGGVFDGWVKFTGVGVSSNPAYEAWGEVMGCDLDTILSHVAENPEQAYRGRLSACSSLRGLVGKGMGYTAYGKGWIRIEDGYLFRIPLLGGLSLLLSRIVPELGYAGQTDFSAKVKIHDGKIETRDALMEGNLLSIRARGSYYFDEKLDFYVRVQLLRKGVIAKVVNLPTFLVTKLFEFHLGGHLKSPKWRPVNFPKELFLIFD